MFTPSSRKPLPPLPGPSTHIATTLPFITYPQPHFHRSWYRKCLHSTPTVRIPYGPEVEYIESEAKYVMANKHRMCMCDSVDGYFFEEVDIVGGNYEEREVVEEYWRILEWEGRREGKGKGKGVKGFLRGVKDAVSPGRKGKETETGEGGRKRVLRWVPRWRRLDGSCGGCIAAAAEGGVEVRWREV
ncbi:uncharacterized protein DFL_005673 [Arthrobotrys flagrans]|uniref:Uncharacterized protein n=1 Tax=Arthrobotrys flagrans TaxID=97331 RepID=A0A436ZY40_ARTFL|nr:hypothetical protein DFL_005673 [Arthrobotrys flagrans]